MKYTLPERNAIIARIEEAEKQLNAEVRTAIITAPTSDLEAILMDLETAAKRVLAQQVVPF